MEWLKPDFKSKYTKEELKKWWIARCIECGWCGLSKELGVDMANETGCCGDVYCPKCNSTDVHDYVKWSGWKWELTFLWKKISFYAYRKKRREEKKLDAMIRAYEQGLYNQSNRTQHFN